MCRINPYKVRFANKVPPAYWIVSGDPIGSNEAKKYIDEIRPYRILLKNQSQYTHFSEGNTVYIINIF